MLQGFKQFILRGNVVDLAVAVVMGVAFGAVVTALVKDLITPFTAAIVGKPDFSAIEFTVNGSKFPIGDFINALVSFILIAAAVYFFIVLPMNTIFAESGAEKSLPTRPPKNARNVSVMCRLRLAVAPSALRSSREARPAEHADSSVSALNDQLWVAPEPISRRPTHAPKTHARKEVAKTLLPIPKRRVVNGSAIEVEEIEQDNTRASLLPLSEAFWIKLNEMVSSGQMPHSSPSR